MNFIASSSKQSVTPQDKWNDSKSLYSKTLTSLSKCVLQSFLDLNSKLVPLIGKTTSLDGIPYTLGCTRWSVSKSAHEFILIDMAHQKSVIHGKVPTKSVAVDVLSHILKSRNCSLDEFFGTGKRQVREQKQNQDPADKGSVKVKATEECLVVFTELMLRSMDIIQKNPPGIKWYLRPCELQLVTKVGKIYNINKISMM